MIIAKRGFISGDVSMGSNLSINNKLNIGNGSGNSYMVDISSANINPYGTLRIYESVGTQPTAIGGSITLHHSDISGVSSITYVSKGQDYGSIGYYDTTTTTTTTSKYNYYNIDTSTNSALVLNTQKNSYNAMDPSSTDSIILHAAGSIIIDACGETMGQTILQPRGGTVGVGKINANTQYALDISGGLTSTSSVITSDYRIKENILPITNQPNYTVDNLQPWLYMNTLINKDDIGFLADELQDEYPFLVVGEKNGMAYQSINYIGLIPILVAEVKRLKQKILEKRK